MSKEVGAGGRFDIFLDSVLFYNRLLEYCLPKPQRSSEDIFSTSSKNSV